MRTRLERAWRRDRNRWRGDAPSQSLRPAKPPLQRHKTLSGGRVHTATQIRDEHPDFVKANVNSAVPWHKMIGMRNRMAHGYFDTDFEIVWDTVKTHLPVLEHFLATRIEQQNGPESDVATPSSPDFGM